MAKRFEFINNYSDVYIVGNSQLAGFKGISKNKDRAMNISMCRGAQIQDCLAECEKRYRLKKNKVCRIYRQNTFVVSYINMLSRWFSFTGFKTL